MLRRKLGLKLARHRWKLLILFGLIITPLYLLGLFDFLFETSFEKFRWPTYDNVRELVAKEMSGETVYAYRVNDYNYFDEFTSITCQKNPLTRKKSLLIIVKSASDRIERRNAHRQTISRISSLNNWKLRTIFVLGRKDAEADKETDPLKRENEIYKDMVTGNFTDHYFNNTYKFAHSLKAAKEYCIQSQTTVPWTILMDDDYLVNVTALLTYLDKHQPNEQLYAGYRYDSSPFRLKFQRFSISLDDYPFAMFPPYITGGFVILSPQAVKEFYYAAQYLVHIKFDDVYAGIVAYMLGYEAQNLNTTFTTPVIRDEKHFNFTTKISEHGYTSDELLQLFPKINPI